MQSMTTHLFAPAAALALLLPLGACATTTDRPIVDGPVAAEGMLVALGQAVAVGDLVVTPRALVEDSRCPQNARCIQAGRVVVTTRIDGAGWRETADLTLGESFATHGRQIALTSALPEKTAGEQTAPAAYRFGYQPRP